MNMFKNIYYNCVFFWLDMEMVPSFQCTNETKNNLTLYSADSNQPVSLN